MLKSFSSWLRRSLRRSSHLLYLSPVLQLVNFHRFLRWRTAITLQIRGIKKIQERRVSRARSTSFIANKKRNWRGGGWEGEGVCTRLNRTGWEENLVRGYHRWILYLRLDRDTGKLTLTFNFKVDAFSFLRRIPVVAKVKLFPSKSMTQQFSWEMAKLRARECFQQLRVESQGTGVKVATETHRGNRSQASDNNAVGLKFN